MFSNDSENTSEKTDRAASKSPLFHLAGLPLPHRFPDNPKYLIKGKDFNICTAKLTPGDFFSLRTPLDVT